MERVHTEDAAKLLVHKPIVAEIREVDSPVATLSKRVEDLREIGPARGKAFRALGVSSLGELLEYFPRDYQYETEEKPLDRLRDGEISIARGEVTAVNYIAGGHGRARFEATLSQGPHRLSLVFFNGAYLRRQIHPGLLLRVRGMVKHFRQIPQMVNPKWETVDENAKEIVDSRFRAVYPANSKLSSETIERIVAANLGDAVAAIDELFPAPLLQKRKLMGRRGVPRDSSAGRSQPSHRRTAAAGVRRIDADATGASTKPSADDDENFRAGHADRSDAGSPHPGAVSRSS